MMRTIGGRPATIPEIRRRARLRAFIAWQMDVPPECNGCGSETCKGCEPATCDGCGDRVANPEARCLACVAGWVA